MDLEKQLLSKYGNNRPFKAPARYFDTLSGRIMEQLKNDVGSIGCERPKHSDFLIRLKPFFIAATVICFVFIIFLSFRAFLTGNETHHEEITSTQDRMIISKPSSDDLDEAVDYMMIDETDMYASLIDN